jgi:hypothetical protein
MYRLVWGLPVEQFVKLIAVLIHPVEGIVKQALAAGEEAPHSVALEAVN